MKLNIIGNGFDLYHGLPSSYYFFGCYLIDNDPEFYEEIGNMYNIRFCEMVGPPIAHDYEYAVEDLFWRDFEKQLGEVDEYFVIDTNDYDLGLENDDPIDIEMNQDENADKLKRSFVHWVKGTLDQDDNYELIQKFINNGMSEVKFKGDDYFFTFNYTHTLQKIYGITDDRIHYVHGECLGNDDDDLTVGHGNDDRLSKVKDEIDKLEQEYNYTQRSRNKINEYHCLLSYLRKLRKDVRFCKYMCDGFYTKISDDIEGIKVYGLSLGEVDIPYLTDIRERWPKAKWEFSFYSDTEKTRICELAENQLNLKKEEYNLFELRNSSSKSIQNEIVELRNITEHRSVTHNNINSSIA